MQRISNSENTVSHLSSYSIIVFALALFAAIILDIVFPMKIFPEPWNQYFGIFVVVVGTAIVYIAEDLGRKFSHRRKRGEVNSVDHLCVGVYCQSRNPKYIGLGVLIIGLGFVLNSLFVTISALVAIIVVHYFLLHKEENLMAERHGDIYHEYKKKVRRWL